jgi:hypothetical protein
MNLKECQEEIEERSYLLGSILIHLSNTYRIMIVSLVPFPVDSDNYHIQCNYFRELSPNKFTGTLLNDKLSDVLYNYDYS